MPTYKPYLNQSYDKIKQECLKSKRLFEDELFPASEKSLYYFNPPEKTIVWKRPHQLFSNPQFIVDSVVPNDLDQGQIGDCWLISSCAAIATVPEYLNTVIPTEGQTFDKLDYAGVFHFRLWRSGEWIDIVVDDLLPVDAETNQLIYCHNSKDQNEMFGPLLEKAFAKLNSCYEFLDGGDPIDAMIDMTGGVHERFKIRSEEQQNDGMLKIEKTKLWEIVFKSFGMKSLASASIEVGSNVQEGILENGLVLGHAYTVETAYELFSSKNNGLFDTFRNSSKQKITTKTIKLLKMRNPWGQNNSWTGKWSSESDEWNKVHENIKKQLDYNSQTNGQFYICFSDFFFNFDRLEFVYVDLNAFYQDDSEADLDFNWEIKQFKGAWIPGFNAGGCGNDDWDYYWSNPQYAVTLETDSSNDNKVSLIVSLIQTEQVRKRAETNGTYESSNEPMSFRVYQVNEKLTKSKYNENQLNEVGNLGIYLGQKEVAKRFDLPPGDYVIIPSLFSKDTPMQFVLRLLMETTKQTSNSGSGNVRSDNKPVQVRLDFVEIRNPNENKAVKQHSWQEESNIIDSTQYDNQSIGAKNPTVVTTSAGCCVIL